MTHKIIKYYEYKIIIKNINIFARMLIFNQLSLQRQMSNKSIIITLLLQQFFEQFQTMSCKKVTLQFISTLLLLISIGLAVAVIYGYVYMQTFFNFSGIIGVSIFGVVIAIVLFIFITSIFGLVGSCNQSKCSLTCYVIILIIWMLLFLGIGIAIYLVIPQFVGGDCKSNSYFTQFEQYYGNATNSYSICQLNCPCYFSNKNAYSTSQLVQLALDAPVQSLSSNAAVQNQQCSTKKWDNGQIQNGDILYQFLQQKLGCTGWCDHNYLYYRFTNVANGVPGYCYGKISSMMNVYGQVVYIVSFVLAGVILLTWIMTLCLISDIGQQNKKQRVQQTERQQNYRY